MSERLFPCPGRSVCYCPCVLLLGCSVSLGFPTVMFTETKIHSTDVYKYLTFKRQIFTVIINSNEIFKKRKLHNYFL